MTDLLTSAQMRAVEAAAIASGAVTGLELMERAGRGVVEAIFEEWPKLRATAHRAVVLCGPGNNGGDGFVVARLLQGWGWTVEVFLYGDAAKMPPDAHHNYRRWCALGPVGVLDDAHAGFVGETSGPPVDLIVDAVFGIGLSRPLPNVVAQGLSKIHAATSRPRAFPVTVAIDLPSGLCADSGVALVEEGAPWLLRCDLTVTFHCAKPGHYLCDGPLRCGAVRVVDIGLPALSPGTAPGDVVTLSGPGSDLGKQSGHKFSYGHALVFSGGVGQGGAARLGARAALRIGAGVVTLGCPVAALAENAARLDAVMLRALEGETAIVAALADARINALCLGPGMGVARADQALRTVLMHAEVAPRALVLDADALTALAQAPDLFSALHPICVLTPHAGEFARLFPDIAAKLAAPAIHGPAYSRVDATREAAARAGCVVLFKGPDTVIARPDGRCAINAAHYERAAPWLATAGSGDVLAGIITGLLARGYGPFDAACAGAWLHVACALRFGPGLIAEDLPEELPKVLRDLWIR